MADWQPWERLPAESAPAFAAFQFYRAMAPAERSLDAVGDALSKPSRSPGKAPGRAPGRVFRWSREHRWVDRARAYDAHVDAETTRAAVRAMADAAGLTVARALKARHEHLRRMTGLVEQVIQKGTAYLSFPATDQMTDGDGGPVLVKAIHARDAEAGARLVFAGHEAMMRLFDAMIRTAAPVQDAPAPAAEPPTADEARAADLARLEAVAAGLTAAGANGDREALSDLIRVQERKAKMLGLDAPPAQQPAAQAGGPIPTRFEVFNPDGHDTDGGYTGCPDGG